MMKKLVSLLICLCLLTSFAFAEETDWDEAEPIGNDRVGYFTPDTAWFEFRSSNLTDEKIAELEASFGFTQYASLELGMVILTMAIYSDILDGSDETSSEDMKDLLLQFMNVDYSNVSARMLAPQWDASLVNDLVPGYLVGVLQVYDEAEDATEPDLAFFYFIHDSALLHFEFERVYDNDTLQAIVDLVSTWTPVLPDA